MNKKLLFTALLLLPMLLAAERPAANPVDLAALEKQIQQAFDRVAPSTVTLFGPENSFKGSGVIIDPDGLILTHGHHELAPGTPMTIMIAGKQKVAGKLLGVNRYFDQSLIRLESPGPYPAVPLGNPSQLKPGETCLMLGFPRIYYHEGRPPLLRIGRILGFAAHQVLTSCRTEGGDSGGPLFNLKGELLATHQMTALKGEHGAGHPTVDCYRQIREQLLAGVEIKRQALEGPFEDPAALADLAKPTNQSVVQILIDNKPACLGLIVDPQGWIVTKGSAITVDQVLCKLSGGRQLEASLQGRVRTHDLALLKIKSEALIAARWSASPNTGQILASVGLDDPPLSLGVACCKSIDVPRERGQLTINLAPAGRDIAGLRITEIWKFRDDVARILHPGDIVTHINNQPTPDVDSFVKVREHELDDPAAVVGDTIPLTILRNGKTLTVNVPIESDSVQQLPEFRGRRSGFPNVFVHDATVQRPQLGGPVVDAQGKVIGLNVATIWGAFTYALPADVVQQAVKEMKAKATAH